MAVVFESESAFNDELAAFIANQSQIAIEQKGFFSVSFSGGSAATKVCKALENIETSEKIDFSKWKIFFCDERYVELTNNDSNYKSIFDGLIIKHPEISQENVFSLNYGESVERAASDYEAQMRNVFQCKSFPTIDLIVLGMGPDGHICSLFPNHELLKDQQHWVVPIADSPKPPLERITMTLNVVNNAETVVFIVTGESKAENVKRAIEGEPSSGLPASLVKPLHGKLSWFLDSEAASLLIKD